MANDQDVVPLDAYADTQFIHMDDEDDIDLSPADYGFELPEIERDVPAPTPRLERVKREPVVRGGITEIKPFLELPEAIRNTVIGRLAEVVARKLEFPEASTFAAILSCASAAVSCAYASQYLSHTVFSLGLYTVIEQPPATQKSYLLSIGARQYAKSMNEHNRKVKAKNRENKERDLPAENNLLYGFSVATDATTAAMDKALSSCSEGRFVISSAEQSALSSIFPEAGTYSSNNELILKGYVGEPVSGMRGGREAFSGNVSGTITIIAQIGSARRVLSASNSTGVSERFFFFAEPSLLGSRELLGEYPSNSETRDYEEACRKCVELYSDRIMAMAGQSDADRVVLDPEHLNKVKPSFKGFNMILQHRRDVEASLGDMLYDGESVAVSWRGKFETHVIKVAAVIHVIECLAGGCYPPEIIPDHIVAMAMDYVDMAAEHVDEILRSNGESGSGAEEDCMVEVLSQKPLSRRELLLKAKNRKPFKSMGSHSYESAGRRVDTMIAEGKLVVTSRGKLEVV